MVASTCHCKGVARLFNNVFCSLTTEHNKQFIIQHRFFFCSNGNVCLVFIWISPVFYCGSCLPSEFLLNWSVTWMWTLHGVLLLNGSAFSPCILSPSASFPTGRLINATEDAPAQLLSTAGTLFQSKHSHTQQLLVPHFPFISYFAFVCSLIWSHLYWWLYRYIFPDCSPSVAMNNLFNLEKDNQ